MSAAHGLTRIQVAMDPFYRARQQAVACARLGVNFIGAEIDEAYLEEASRDRDATKKRWRRASQGWKGRRGLERRITLPALLPTSCWTTRALEAA